MNRAGTTLADWLARLETFSPHEIELGLDRVRDVLERMALKPPGTVLHIAGTNGKGSSVSMAEALLTGHDVTVGSYTSPHLVSFNERIRVDGQPVADDEIIAAFERVAAARNDTPLTYFEYATLAAMVVFEARNVGIVILEVGMGGRLDAVNAVEPSAGLITNVSLDHCAWLGDDVESIAAEKAGIMRANKAVIYASADVPDAICRVADDMGARLVLAGRDYEYARDRESWSYASTGRTLTGLRMPGLAGNHQIENAAGVIALLEAAGFGERLGKDAVDRAMTSLQLAGRLQRVTKERQWLFDVAHNAAAATALADYLGGSAADGTTAAIVGLLDDKHVDGVVSPLVPHVDHWIAVRAASSRAIAAAELARQIANAADKACLIAATLDEAIEYARELTSRNDCIVVTGSFYIVGPALDALGIYSARPGNS